MIDPATLVGASGAVAVLWGGSKLIAWVNRPKGSQLPRSPNISNQIASLEHWHMLWSHPDNDTEFYAWDDAKGWIERDIERVVKDMIGWDDYSYGVRMGVDRKIGVLITDGVWGPDHLEKVVDYGVFLVKDLLQEYAESDEYKTQIKRSSLEDSVRRIWELKAERVGSFEYTPGPQRYALDSSTDPVLESKLRRIKRIANQIQQCDDGEMKRRLIQRLDELENK